MRHDLLQVVEEVLVKYLQRQNDLAGLFYDEEIDRWRIYRGFENIDTIDNEGRQSSIIRQPCVIVDCDGADPILPYAPGNWDVTADVQVQSVAPDFTHAQHQSLVEAIYTRLFDGELLSRLMEIDTEFFATGIIVGRQSKRIEGNIWVNSQQFIFRHASGNAVPEE